jgi:hypothetical protein
MRVIEGAVMVELKQNSFLIYSLLISATHPEKADNSIDPHFQTQSKELLHAVHSKNVLEGTALSVSGRSVSYRSSSARASGAKSPTRVRRREGEGILGSRDVCSLR